MDILPSPSSSHLIFVIRPQPAVLQSNTPDTLRLAPGQEMTIFYTIYFTPGPDYLGKEFGENTKIHGNFPFKVGYIISLDPPTIEWKILSQSVFAVLDVSPPL